MWMYGRIRKLPGVSLESHLKRIHTFLQERLAEIPNDCLRFDHNQAPFFLKTLLLTHGDVTGLGSYTLRTGHITLLEGAAYASGRLWG